MSFIQSKYHYSQKRPSAEIIENNKVDNSKEVHSNEINVLIKHCIIQFHFARSSTRTQSFDLEDYVTAKMFSSIPLPMFYPCRSHV